MSVARSLAVALLALLVVSGGVVAVSTPRDRPADTSPVVRVFVGETLDVSAVQLTGGGTVGTSPVTLVGVAGDAEGEVRQLDDPTDADFGDFATGTYSVQKDSDDRPEFALVEPRVTDVTVRNQNGANVTNGWEPTGEQLTVTAKYNFEVADRLDLTVRDPDGFDVTDQIASSDRITTSGGSVRLDLSDEQDGQFRIVLEGHELDDARKVVTVRTGPRETTTTTRTTTRRTTTTTRTTATTQPTSTTPTTSSTPATTTTTTTAATATTTSPPTTTTQPTEAPSPGFGPLAVVVALLALAGYALRRR